MTRDSVCKIATEILELEVQETDIFLSDLFSADEVFCTGTAVQITPVGTVTHNNILYKYNNGDIGPVTKKLKTLTKYKEEKSMIFWVVISCKYIIFLLKVENDISI